MTIGPLTNDREQLRDSFIQLRELMDTLKQSSQKTNFTQHSMGMSGDYEIAVEEGSTMVRLGTPLLGKRNPLSV